MCYCEYREYYLSTMCYCEYREYYFEYHVLQ